MATKSKPHRFLATIYKIWMMRHVTVPLEVSRVLAKELASSQRVSTKRKIKQQAKSAKSARPKYIPVVATVNSRTSRTTLVPAGDGCYRLQINTALRKVAQADVGDVITVELQLDLASRELPVPADLLAALKEHPKARKAFDALPTGLLRQYIKWFDSAKAPQTRIRRLARAMDILLERATLGKPRRAS